MTVRSQIAGALKAALPDYLVIGYPRTPDGLGQPAVVVTQTAVAKHPQVPSRWLVELELLVLAPQDDPAAAEDTLDESLEPVIAALESGDVALLWTRADRVTVADKYPAYKITATTLADETKEETP